MKQYATRADALARLTAIENELRTMKEQSSAIDSVVRLLGFEKTELQPELTRLRLEEQDRLQTQKVQGKKTFHARFFEAAKGVLDQQILETLCDVAFEPAEPPSQCPECKATSWNREGFVVRDGQEGVAFLCMGCGQVAVWVEPSDAKAASTGGAA